MQALRNDCNGIGVYALGDPFSVHGVPAEQAVLSAAVASRSENQDTIDLAVLSGLKNDQGSDGLSGGPFSSR